MRPYGGASAGTRTRWRALAAAAALVPEIVLPLESLATSGYLTPDPGLISVVLLPCAALALFASVHEAGPLRSGGSGEEATLAIGLPIVGFLLALAATGNIASGEAACYHCEFAWFFMLTLPSMVLEFAAGVIWLSFVWDALREPRAVGAGAE